MQGLGGNDIYFVDNAGDVVIEAAGGGTDRVATSVSYVLAAGQEIEFFTTDECGGTSAINLTGNELANPLSAMPAPTRSTARAAPTPCRGSAATTSSSSELAKRKAMYSSTLWAMVRARAI